MTDSNAARPVLARMRVVFATASVACLLSALTAGCVQTGVPASALPIPWPAELPAALSSKAVIYESPKSNYLLDFHGSAYNPDLVIFMAGNQYRVFPELIAAFRDWAARHPNHRALRLDNLFYATLPPGRLIDAMDAGQLAVGNFWFDVRPDALWPDIFMTGPRQQVRLFKSGYIDSYSVYTRNRGSVLLVRAGNPKNIRGVGDLERPDIRVAISAPKIEPASFDSYANMLSGLGGKGLPERILAKPDTVSPVAVHHRENPQFIADGVADVAPMYFHFGDYLKRHMPHLFDYVALPADGNVIDQLGIARIKNARRGAAADAWIEFIRSDDAAGIYNRHGFDYASQAERNALVVPK